MNKIIVSLEIIIVHIVTKTQYLLRKKKYYAIVSTMNKLFSNESAFGIFFGQLGDIVIVNLLFVLTSLPLVSIGCSLCGMNYAFLKRRRGSDDPISRLYFEGLRSNFKQGTAEWILFVALLLVSAADRQLFSALGSSPNAVLYWFFTVIGLLTYFIGLYLFAATAAFEAPIGRQIANSFFLAASHIPTTLVLGAVPLLLLGIGLSGFQALAVLCSFLLLFGFGLIGWCSSFLYIRLFNPLLDR